MPAATKETRRAANWPARSGRAGALQRRGGSPVCRSRRFCGGCYRSFAQSAHARSQEPSTKVAHPQTRDKGQALRQEWGARKQVTNLWPVFPRPWGCGLPAPGGRMCRHSTRGEGGDSGSPCRIARPESRGIGSLGGHPAQRASRRFGIVRDSRGNSRCWVYGVRRADTYRRLTRGSGEGRGGRGASGQSGQRDSSSGAAADG